MDLDPVHQSSYRQPFGNPHSAVPLAAYLTPVHRAIVAVDIQASTTRTDVAKAGLRRAMYSTLEAALQVSGITDENHDPLVDRGDGAFVLIRPVDHAPKTLLLHTLIPAMQDCSPSTTPATPATNCDCGSRFMPAKYNGTGEDGSARPSISPSGCSTHRN